MPKNGLELTVGGGDAGAGAEVDDTGASAGAGVEDSGSNGAESVGAKEGDGSVQMHVESDASKPVWQRSGHRSAHFPEGWDVNKTFHNHPKKPTVCVSYFPSSTAVQKSKQKRKQPNRLPFASSSSSSVSCRRRP